MKLKQLALRSGRWEAAVAPDFGANLTKLAYDGFPILRSPEREEELLSKSRYVYGNPLLLPPNRTKDGSFCFEGRSYSLPVNEPERSNHLHGLFTDAPFRVVKHTEIGRAHV